jgi:AcrR family transcriptional regulator
MSEPTMRSDARQNRDRIVGVATRAFAESGPGASLEEVAREAGVGIGTLYRHFPTRDALFVAVHRAEIACMAERADELLASHGPRDALGRWLEEFLDFMHAKKGMAEVFRSVMSSGENPFLDLRAETTAAVDRLLSAVRVVEAMSDIDAFDLLTALHGISLATDDPDQAARLLRFLEAGFVSDR